MTLCYTNAVSAAYYNTFACVCAGCDVQMHCPVSGEGLAAVFSEGGRMKKAVLVVCLLLMLCGVSAVSFSTAHAAGFALYEWSSRGNGMGGAMTALVDDPSAIAHNPSAMTQVEGTQTMAGFTLIQPKADLEIGGTTYNSKGKVYIPPHAYITHQVNDDLWVGFGTYTRFGVGTNYDHDWAGRYNVYKASLQSHSFSPTVAYKLTDKWSLGVALDAMWLAFDLRQIITPLSPTAPNGDLHIDNSGWAWGGNVSTHYEFNEYFSLGAIYRSPQRLVGSGTAKVDGTSIEDDMTMRATLPGSLTMGAAVKPTDWWRFAVDAVYTNWTDYKQIEYRTGSAIGTAAFGGATSVDSTKNWHNTWRFQVGTEFDLNENHTLRFGYVWDKSPIDDKYRDYMLPSNDRQMYSVGYGFKKDAWSLDFSLMYLDMKDTTIDAAKNAVGGVLDTEISGSHAYLGGLTFGYEF